MKKRKSKKKIENKVKINGNTEFNESLENFSNYKKCISNYGNNHIIRIEYISLEKYKLSNISLKNCELKNSKIKYSYINDNSYLRHTSFNNVDFTGTIFENVNLEKASFKECTLNYVRFENCNIDYKSILESKPHMPNLCMLLLKSLYKNELQQGNTREADELQILYKKEERELYKRFLDFKKDKKKKDPMYQNENYYEEEMKRKGLNKIKVFLRLLSSYLDYLIWGHGIIITKIFISIFICIFLFATSYSFFLKQNFYEALLISIKSWIIKNENTENILVDCIMLLENFLGLISLALFTSALYRKVEK